MAPTAAASTSDSRVGVLDALRLHPERMELLRSMERWAHLTDGAIGRHHFLARTERDMTIERMRQHSRFDAAWRAAQNKSAEAVARLTVLADWLRLRFTDGSILQTTDEVDLVLRHTDLDPAVPAWAFNVADATSYIAFGESWASRPTIATLGRQSAMQVEGCYVSCTQVRKGLRVMDISVIGRSPARAGGSAPVEIVDAISIRIEQEMQPLLAVLAEALAGQRRARSGHLAPMVMTEVLTHVAKVLLYAAATDEKRVLSLRPRSARGDTGANSTAFYPKVLVGPSGLEPFLPSNLTDAEADTVWHWRAGHLAARPERDALRVVFTAPSLEPRLRNLERSAVREI